MRILHVIGFSGFGGTESYAIDVFREFERQGHELVIAFAGNDQAGLSVPGRTVVRLRGLPGATESGDPAAQLASLLRIHRPDIALTHFNVGQAIAAVLAADLPTVAFAHNYVGLCPSASFFYSRTGTICHLTDTPGWRCLLNAYRQHCCPRQPGALLASYREAVAAKAYLLRFDAIICDSAYVRDRYVAHGFSPGRFEVAPSPVHMPDEDDPGQERDGELLAFAGRITPHKGLHVLLEALNGLARPFRLVVAGDGYDLTRCQALASERGLSDRVSFAGHLPRDRLRHLYRQAALMVVPSIWPEPFCMVGPEAMAYGLPVVASDAGAIPEWLEDGRTGLLARPNDPASLREKIELLLGDGQRRAAMGRAAQSLVRDRFTVTAHVQQLSDLFRTVAGSSATPTMVASP